MHIDSDKVLTASKCLKIPFLENIIRYPKPMETPFFFPNNSYRLFGILHEPEKVASDFSPQSSGLKGLGIVFCHPFAEEKLIAHRVMVNLARRLTEEGLYCLRFDYMGHGDSDANFEDSTIETRLSDIRCAVDYLKKWAGVKKIGLLGVRFGATLAVLTCMHDSDIDCLILVSPVIDGKSYVEQCLRSNLATQMATYRRIVKERGQLIKDLMAGEMINIDGYLLTKALYEQMEAIHLSNSSFVLPKDIMLIEVSKNKNQTISDELKEFYINCKNMDKRIELSIVEGDYFWKENKIYDPYLKDLQEKTIKWLNNIYPPPLD